jgi:hypothetical protein
MNASSRRADGILAVQVVRQRDVDGIDLSARQTLLILVVRVQSLDRILLAEFLELYWIVRDQCCKL